MLPGGGERRPLEGAPGEVTRPLGDPGLGPGARRSEMVVVAGGLLLATLLFCLPALSPGVVFIAGDVLLAHPPFQAAYGHDLVIRNPSLSDQTTIYYPWLWYARARIRAGRFPLWTPESYAGAPFFGNLSTGLLFPLTWLFIVLPFGLAFVVVAVLKLWMAGFFLYLFLRDHGLARSAALVGALAYPFAGYNVVWLHYALSHVAVLAPLLLWLAERWYRRPTVRRGVCVSAGLAASFLGGHPETTVSVGAVVGAYLVCRTARLAHSGGRKVWLALAALLTLSVGLVAVQLLPFAEYLWHSEGRRLRDLHVALPGGTDRVLTLPGLVLAALGLLALVAGIRRLRRAGRTPWGGVLGAACLIAAGARLVIVLGANPAAALLVLPHLYGDPTATAGYWGPHTFNDVSGGFIGCLAFLLAVVALVGRSESFLGTFFRWAWLLALAVAFRLPGPYQLARHLPVLAYLAETRVLVAVALGGAVLAAVGADRLLSRVPPRPERRRTLARLAASVGVGLPVFALSASVPFDRLWPDHDPDARPGELVAPAPGTVHGAREPLEIRLRLEAGVEQVRVTLDGQTIATRDRPARDRAAGWQAGIPVLLTARADDGVYRIRADGVDQDGTTTEIATRSFRIRRPREIDGIDLAILVGALILMVGWWVGPRPVRPLLARSMPLLIFLELLYFGQGYNPVTPTDRLFPRTETTDFLAQKTREEGPFRVLPEGTLLQPNTHYVYGFDHLRGYDCMEPRGTIRLLRFLSGGRDVPWRDWNRHTINYESPLFDLFGVRYVISPENLDDVAGLERVLRADGLVIYRNREALPRAFIVSQATRIEGQDLARLMALDPRRTAFLEVTPPPMGGTGKAELISYDAGRVEVGVKVRGAALLLLTDTFFPGWEARVDGERREILRTHGAFRAVPVREGDQRVVFEYRPASLMVGAVISLLAGLLAAGGLLAGGRRRRRDGPGPESCAAKMPSLESS